MIPKEQVNFPSTSRRASLVTVLRQNGSCSYWQRTRVALSIVRAFCCRHFVVGLAVDNLLLRLGKFCLPRRMRYSHHNGVGRQLECLFNHAHILAIEEMPSDRGRSLTGSLGGGMDLDTIGVRDDQGFQLDDEGRSFTYCGFDEA